MKIKIGLAIAALASTEAFAGLWNGFRAPAKEAVEHEAGFLWLEAEEFADYGGWVIDTQFVGKMGSAYLLANGVTNRVSAAKTIVKIPCVGGGANTTNRCAGVWRVWARSRDWIPEYHPGLFTIAINGRRGKELGGSGKKGWCWQFAGAFELPAGAAEVALEDLTGWFGRCDALVMTTDADYVPPDDLIDCEKARVKLSGLPPETDDGAYEVIIVGAGPSGTTAAIQSARAGAKTLLVHDRPILGGNASSEFRIAPRGAGTYRKEYQEGGIDAEMLALKASRKGSDWTDAYQALVDRETNLTVIANMRITCARTDERGSITSVCGVDTLTGARAFWRGKIFVDATGDGWLGFFAHAKFRFGSEGKAEFGEPNAPDAPNGRTMSGSLFSGLGKSSGCAAAFLTVRTPGGKFDFTPPVWANLDTGARRRVRHFRSAAIEHPHEIDDVEDPEYARDYLIRMSVSYWDFGKNRAENRAEGAEWQMVSIPHTNARREGRRLVGDYILTEKDEMEGRRFPDAIGYGGYPITTHNSAGTFGNNHDACRPEPPLYDIPYRSLYSVNVPNLLMCGRCVSMTHRALGSMRVQSTCSVTGQAAGLAAARCVQRGLSPREYGRLHIGELQTELRAAGQRFSE